MKNKVKRISKRVLAALLGAMMIVLVVAPASAREAISDRRNEASRSEYIENVYQAKLSVQAENYYKDEVKQYITNEKVYDSFLGLAGNQLDNDVDNSLTASQNNDLYTALYNIMSSTHTHGVTYSGTSGNSLAHYWLTTDSSNLDEGNNNSYTFFYSDVPCVGNKSMQREHIWPKSQASFHMKTGLGGSDLHHLRPAYGTVNNIKSNWGFADLHEANNGDFKSDCSNTRTVEWPAGTTSLWRADAKRGNDSKTTYIDVKDDVRGDVARILLYVYVRWQQPNLFTDVAEANLPTPDDDDSKNDGKKVIESRATLLKWMKEDPVSQWEMERNDLTEDIQGNRNVFIDYPELAWLLFDQTVPNDMDTPSGMAKTVTGDINKDNTVISNPVTLDFGTVSSCNGIAEITAFNDTTKKSVKNGDTVSRGDSIKYTITPDQSTIAYIYEYKSDADSGEGLVNTVASPNVTTAYSFTRQAGYYNGSSNSGYNKERIKVTVNSDVTILNYTIKGTTKALNSDSSGSGSGMVTARIAGTSTIVENGGSVPNNTDVVLTFTPDFGSRFNKVTNKNSITVTPTQISGTDSYEATINLDCSNGTKRTKSFTVKFAQTADKSDNITSKYIDNRGLSPDTPDQDPWGEAMDFTQNFQICGTQIKNYGNSENKALRFISVIDKKILYKAQEYGYVLGYTTQSTDNKFINQNAYELVINGSVGITVDCTGTDNEVFGDYGKHDTDKNYKYITVAVNNIQDADGIGEDTVIIARPYVVLKPGFRVDGAPSVIYGQYMDAETGEAYCACSGSYTQIAALAAAQ